MTRTTLPTRRDSRAFDFEHHEVRYRATVNAAGTLQELFLDAGHLGSSANIMAKEAAVLFSIAAQYGVPIEVMSSALPRLADGSPAGAVGTALKIAQEMRQ